MGKRSSKERQVCKAIARMLSAAHAPGVVAFHVPNGEARDKVTGAILKGMGVRAGVADYVIICPSSGKVHFMEVKVAGGRQSRAQRDFQRDIEAAASMGAPVEYAVVDGLDGALDYLQRIGAIRILPFPVRDGAPSGGGRV